MGPEDFEYYERRERRVAQVAVYVVCGWMGLAGGMLGYWVMRFIHGLGY